MCVKIIIGPIRTGCGKVFSFDSTEVRKTQVTRIVKVCGLIYSAQII